MEALIVRISPFWMSSLLSAQTHAERVGATPLRVENARQALGIDIYAARAISKRLGATTPQQVWELHYRAMQVAAFENSLRRALCSRDDALIHVFRRLTANPHRAFALAAAAEAAQEEKPPDGQEGQAPEEEDQDHDQEETDDDIPPPPAANPQGLNPALIQEMLRRKSVNRMQQTTANDEALLFSESDDDEGDHDGREADVTFRAREHYRRQLRGKQLLPSGAFLDQVGDNEQQIRVELPEFQLGPEGGDALVSALRDAPPVSLLDLSGNFLSEGAGRTLADVLRVQPALTELRLRGNRLGDAAAAAVLDAISPQLDRLVLADNGLESALRLAGRGFRRGCALRSLDLSRNRLNESAGVVLGRLIAGNATLEWLDLRWNSLGGLGAAALAGGFKTNSVLRSVFVAFNNIGEVGAIAFAEVLTSNHTLQDLDLSHNGVPHTGALLLSDAIRLNSGLTRLDLDHNVLSRAGAEVLLRALGEAPSGKLRQLSLRASDTGDSNLTPNHIPYDPHDVVGHYRLDLGDPWQHGIAELLRVRSLFDGCMWQYPTLNGRPLNCNPALWHVPASGLLKLDFLQADEETNSPAAGDPNAQQAPGSVHFDLDLADEDHRALARTLLERAAGEPGENILNETLDGEPLQLDEDLPPDAFLDLHPAGRLQLDYVSTTLLHQEHYRLDLAVQRDTATVWKLLERFMQSSTQSSGADRIARMQYNGERVTLGYWRLEDGAGTSPRTTWRLPAMGVLEFDYLSTNPFHVASEHYVLNLANQRDRRVAETLRVRAMEEPGENWFNERVDGYPFSMLEDAKRKFQLPRRGILELDYVITQPQHATKRMATEKHAYDLARPQQLDRALRLRQWVVDNSESDGTMWVNVRVGGQRVPRATVMDPHWQLPRKGQLAFDFVYLREHDPMTPDEFGALFEALAAMDERERLKNVPPTLYLTADMALDVVGLFAEQDERRGAMETLAPRVVNKHMMGLVWSQLVGRRL